MTDRKPDRFLLWLAFVASLCNSHYLATVCLLWWLLVEDDVT